MPFWLSTRRHPGGGGGLEAVRHRSHRRRDSFAPLSRSNSYARDAVNPADRLARDIENFGISSFRHRRSSYAPANEEPYHPVSPRAPSRRSRYEQPVERSERRYEDDYVQPSSRRSRYAEPEDDFFKPRRSHTTRVSRPASPPPEYERYAPSRRGSRAPAPSYDDYAPSPQYEERRPSVFGGGRRPSVYGGGDGGLGHRESTRDVERDLFAGTGQERRARRGSTTSRYRFII